MNTIWSAREDVGFAVNREDPFAAAHDVDVVRLRVPVQPAARAAGHETVEMHVHFFSPKGGVDQPRCVPAPLLHRHPWAVIEINNLQHGSLLGWSQALRKA